jgi:hypothetical protein
VQCAILCARRGRDRLALEATLLDGKGRDVRIEPKLKDRTLTFDSQVLFRSDLRSFHYKGTRRLLQDGVLVREKTWEDTIPRDHQ